MLGELPDQVHLSCSLIPVLSPGVSGVWGVGWQKSCQGLNAQNQGKWGSSLPIVAMYTTLESVCLHSNWRGGHQLSGGRALWSAMATITFAEESAHPSMTLFDGCHECMGDVCGHLEQVIYRLQRVDWVVEALEGCSRQEDKRADQIVFTG